MRLAPVPSLSRLDELVDAAGEAGLRVTCQLSGQVAALPPMTRVLLDQLPIPVMLLDDEERARTLYAKLSNFLPGRFKKKWTPVGLNERLRFYRYDVGQQFDWHLDGYFERPDGDRSVPGPFGAAHR